jgi:hypothetical protein
MRNGNTILVGEGFITTKLQQALIQLEANGVIATLLLCTGTFSGLQGTYPLFIPFKIGCSHLSAHQMHSIGLITPIAAQEVPIRARWAKMGWQPTVWTADLGMQDKAFHRQLTQKIRKYGLECIVLDYFGHPSVQVNQLQKSVEIPVIDLGHLAMVTLANSL